MNTKILHILLIVLFFANSVIVNSQEPLNPNWDKQKIKGVRYMPYPPYSGSPFLNESWVSGKIEFSDGEVSDSLFLRYSAFRDELLYYNKEIASHIVIDKASISGFSFITGDGITRVFRKQYYDGFMSGDRYFEILSEGETDLIVFRKIILANTMPYKGEGGILLDQNYVPAYQYYFYTPEKGFTYIRINTNAFLEKFAEKDQKAIKKLIRKNRIRITEEESLILAWKIAEKEGFKIIFN